MSEIAGDNSESQGTSQNIIYGDPRIEAYKLGLYEAAKEYLETLRDSGIQPPTQSVAGLSAEQLGAGAMLRSGLGAYEPYLYGGLNTLMQGQGLVRGAGMDAMRGASGAMYGGLGSLGQAEQTLGQAGGLAAAQRGTPYQFRDEAMGTLRGTGGAYDPQSYQAYMDPYTQEVIDAEQAEIARLGRQQANQAAAGATSSGAFGGSRAALQQTEIGRNTLQQQARTGAQLRSQGYQQAQQQAQQNFEQQQRRQQQQAQIGSQIGLGYGQLGQADVNQMLAIGQAQGQLGQARGQIGQGIGALGAQIGQMGGRLGAMGTQQAQFGGMLQAANLADANALMQYGELTRGAGQDVLDADYQARQRAYLQPFTNLAFLSDLTSDLPSSQFQMFNTPEPAQPSFISQAGGLTAGIAGLANAFGGGGSAPMFN